IIAHSTNDPLLSNIYSLSSAAVAYQSAHADDRQRPDQQRPAEGQIDPYPQRDASQQQPGSEDARQLAQVGARQLGPLQDQARPAQPLGEVRQIPGCQRCDQAAEHPAGAYLVPGAKGSQADPAGQAWVGRPTPAAPVTGQPEQPDRPTDPRAGPQRLAGIAKRHGERGQASTEQRQQPHSPPSRPISPI